MLERPWLRSYPPGLPPTLEPYPEKTLLDVVSETAAERPSHPAVLFKGARLTCEALERRSDAVAAALAAEGVRPGDRVALLLPNVPQTIVVQLGAWKAGAVVFPLNPLLAEPELEAALDDTGAETVFVLTPFYAKVKAVQPRTAVRRVVATSVKEHLPPVLRLLFTLLKEKKEGHRAALAPGDLLLPDLLRRHAGAPPPGRRPAPSDPALLLLTGGTTGTAKAALATHRSLFVAALQLHAFSATIIRDWVDVAMVVVPLFHVYGNVCLLGTCLVGRYPMALVPNPRDLDDLLKTVRRERPGFLHAVPALFNALLAHPAVREGRVDLSSIRVCYSASAPLPPETRRRFEERTGGRLLEAYSLTEAMMATVVCPPQAAYREGSVGVPLPDVEVRIVDDETGEKILGPGEVGEVVMRAPQLMSGFWGRPEETSRMIRGGWLHTGDLGRMDEDGFLFVVDRKKDVIKASGFQVWPREVEDVLSAHPAVAEAAVAGVPDDRLGEAVRAWVVLRDGAIATAEELREHCRARLSAYKVPRVVELRSCLPRTLVGKVLRRALVAEHRARTA